MDFTYLHTFREVAIRQSFTRAAEVLGYAQSSVTTQIQKLEKAYNVQLFERYSNNKIRLTSAGEELYSWTNAGAFGTIQGKNGQTGRRHNDD